MQTEITQNHSLKYKYIIRHLQRIVISEICCRFPIYFFRLDSILKKTFMLLKRDYINKVKVIRKYMSSTLTEIFTSQKTLGQCTDQIFTKSSNKWRKKPKVRASTLPPVWNSRKRAWKSVRLKQMLSNVILSFSWNEVSNAPPISGPRRIFSWPGIWAKYSAGFGKCKISWGDKGFVRYSGSGIRQNLGLECGIWKENVIRDGDDRSSRSGVIVVKKEWKSAIRIRLTSLSRHCCISYIQCSALIKVQSASNN